MTKRESIQISLDAAESWERKGNFAWVSRNLSSAIVDYLSIAVEEYATCDLAAVWLREQGFPTLLFRQLDATRKFIVDVDAGRIPGSTLGGNYQHLALSHLAWALNEKNLGESYVDIAVRPDVKDVSTPFWQEYAKGMAALVQGRSYRVSNLEIRGQEQYWLAHLHLIEQATQGGDLSAAAANIDKAFADRNADSSIEDDGYEIEGSGSHPVRWDFRRAGILNYIASVR